MSKVESESRFSLNQKLIISTLIIILAVVATPVGYAIVEPHIKITMDALQTTKPIQVVDSQDNEVFSVDTDGTLFPAPVNFEDEQVLSDINNGKQVLFFEQLGETSTSVSVVGNNFDDYETLAEWRIDFTTTEQDTSQGILPYVHISNGLLSAFTRVDIANFGTVELRYKNLGSPAWTGILFNGEDVVDSWAGDMDTEDDNQICFRGDFVPVDPCTFKLGFGNFNTVAGSPTQLQIKEVKLYLELVLPSGATLTRVT